MSTATVWLINPKGRKEKGSTTTMSKTKTAGRTPAQIAATKKMLAGLKRYRAAQAAQGATSTSRAQPKQAKTYTKSAPAQAPAKAKTYKRNPLPPRVKAHAAEAGGILQANLIPAAMGAGAALGFDLIWGKLPIGDKLRTGNLKYPVKVIGALALGMAAERLLPPEHKHHAVTLARGPLTVILHDFGKDFIAKNYPKLTLAAYEADALAEIMETEQPVMALPAPAIVEPGVGEALDLRMNTVDGLGNWYAQPSYAGVAY